jgi:hypothetical protein
MDSNGILSVVAIVTSVGGAVLALINHTRVRSVCCGKKLEVSLDVEKTTPPAPADSQGALKISVPQKQAAP